VQHTGRSNATRRGAAIAMSSEFGRLITSGGDSWRVHPSSFSNSRREVYQSFMNLDQTPEQWISGSLSNFHWHGQEQLTLPFLDAALEALPWVKENRRIFFMPAWVESFVGSHHSEEALAIVEAFLARHPQLALDIRRKLEVPLHELRRAVKLRKLWSGASSEPK
jgi:aminopeptidase N